MGAWGVGPWENDDAQDFLDEIEAQDPEERGGAVLTALDGVLSPRGYIEAPDMTSAIAAAALVGASYNPSAAQQEPGLPAWLAETPLHTDQELVEKSRRVLRNAVRSTDNELWELWQEAGDSDGLTAAVKRLLAWLGDRDD